MASGPPIRRLFRVLLRFRSDADFVAPGMRHIGAALATLERALESVLIDTVVRLRGRRPVRQSANQFRRHIFYQNIKIRPQKQKLPQLRSAKVFGTFWTAHAGLGDPWSSQRTVDPSVKTSHECQVAGDVV